MRTRTRKALAVLPIALLVALTGCGPDTGDGAGVASATGGDTSSGDSGESAEPMSEDEQYEQMLDYAQCLREHGLDVQDPAPGEGIEVRIEGGPDKSDAALEACEDLAPQPPAGGPDQREARADMLAYAKCMRDNGVEEFEDPKPGKGIHLDATIAEDPDFEEAEQACAEHFGGKGERVESGGGKEGAWSR